MALHYAVMVVAFVACWMVFYRREAIQGLFFTRSVVVCTAYIALLLVLDKVYNVYKVGWVSVSELVYSQTLANLISLCITYFLASLLAKKMLRIMPGTILMIGQFVWSMIWTILANKQYFKLYEPKKAVIIYRNEKDLEKLKEVHYITNRWKIDRVVQWDGLKDCFTTDNQGKNDEEEIYQLMEIMRDYEVVFVSGIAATLRNGIAKHCVDRNKECYFVPHTGDIITAGAEHMRTMAVPICCIKRSMPSPEYLFIKRLIDVVASATAIVILSPFMLLTAALIKVYDHGPVLYKQVRLTKDGKRFEILKFRSMKVDAEKDGVARLASENDDRITPVGKVIRAIRFDELPQLFNILRGDMTIVGPRPERPEIAAQYEEDLPAFSLRLQVKAGLTGYAQVYGRYNTEPQDKLKMDLMYINHMCLSEDFKLIFATIRILFLKDSTQGIEAGQTTAAQVKNKKSA